MKFITALLTVSVSLLLATTAVGQTQNDISKKTKKWRTSMSISALSLDSENTSSQGLGETAFGLDIAGNYYFSPKLITTLGFGIANIKDNEDFSQTVTVTSLFGSDTENAKSSVTSFPVFAEISYRSLSPSDPGYGYGVGAGFTQFLGTERSISRCIGCRSEDVTIDGGAYLTASAYFNTGRSSKFGLSARQFVSGDVRTSILLWIEIN